MPAPAQRADFIIDLAEEDVTISETYNGDQPYPAVNLSSG